MSKYEICKQKEIDEEILKELRKNLEIRKENIDILSQDEIEKIFEKIEEKKEAIFSIFQGDFSLNEQNIKEKMPKTRKEMTLYDKVANNVILKKVEEVFSKIMNAEPKNGRLISVCADRQFFIQKVISENINTSFIKDCIKNECLEKNSADAKSIDEDEFVK